MCIMRECRSNGHHIFWAVQQWRGLIAKRDLMESTRMGTRTTSTDTRHASSVVRLFFSSPGRRVVVGCVFEGQ